MAVPTLDPALYDRAKEFYRNRQGDRAAASAALPGIANDVQYNGISSAAAVQARLKPPTKGQDFKLRYEIAQTLAQLEKAQQAAKSADAKARAAGQKAMYAYNKDLIHELFETFRSLNKNSTDANVAKINGYMNTVDKAYAAEAKANPSLMPGTTGAKVLSDFVGAHHDLAGADKTELVQDQNFWLDLQEALGDVPAEERAVFLSQVDAQMGTDAQTYPGAVEPGITGAILSEGFQNEPGALSAIRNENKLSVEGIVAAQREAFGWKQRADAGLQEIQKLGGGGRLDKASQGVLGALNMLIGKAPGEPIDTAKVGAAVAASGGDGEGEGEGTGAGEGEGEPAVDQALGPHSQAEEQLLKLEADIEAGKTDESIQAQKRALMASPGFQSFLEKRGMTMDPEFGFRMLMKETKAAIHGNRKQARINYANAQELGQATGHEPDHSGELPSGPVDTKRPPTHGDAETGAAMPAAEQTRMDIRHEARPYLEKNAAMVDEEAADEGAAPAAPAGLKEEIADRYAKRFPLPQDAGKPMPPAPVKKRVAGSQAVIAAPPAPSLSDEVVDKVFPTSDVATAHGALPFGDYGESDPDAPPPSRNTGAFDRGVAAAGRATYNFLDAIANPTDYVGMTDEEKRKAVQARMNP